MATGTTAEQTIDVVTPAAGESVSEGTILEWRVKVGEQIKADETIVEISTDKVDIELPAPASGTVTELLVEEGETVTVGQVIARIAVGGGNGAARSATDGGNGARTAGRAAESTVSDESGDAAGSRAGTAAGRTIDVVTPAAGESVSEGTILEWRVKVGDFIKADETIVEISTDKVDLQLHSPARGRVVEILMQEGETVTVGQVIARIAAQDSAPSDSAARGDAAGEDGTGARAAGGGGGAGG